MPEKRWINTPDKADVDKPVDFLIDRAWCRVSFGIRTRGAFLMMNAVLSMLAQLIMHRTVILIYALSPSYSILDAWHAKAILNQHFFCFWKPLSGTSMPHPFIHCSDLEFDRWSRLIFSLLLHLLQIRAAVIQLSSLLHVFKTRNSDGIHLNFHFSSASCLMFLFLSVGWRRSRFDVWDARQGRSR